MLNRYLATEDAWHPCCYGASVVDQEVNRDIVCECPDIATATKIADALNAAQSETQAAHRKLGLLS